MPALSSGIGHSIEKPRLVTGAGKGYLWGMKQIEGRATRVQKYDRMFFWYVPACAIFLAGLGLAAMDWNWIALGMIVPGVMIGVVLGVVLKDVP